MRWTTANDVSGFEVRRSAEMARIYRAAGYWPDTTLVDDVRARLRADPDRILVIDQGKTLSCAQAWEQALALAAFFRSRGLQPGDTVSFQLPNWQEAMPLVLAVRMCGLVVNPVQPIYRSSEVGYILAAARSRMIFAPHIFRGFNHLEMLEALKPSLPALRDIVVVRAEGPVGAAIGWEQAIAGPPLAESLLPKLDASAVMLAMFTSGTTSRAKGVLHSHQTYGFKPRFMCETWGLTSADTVFMPSPISHINGMFWGVDIPWRFGLTSVLLDVWSAQQAIGLIGQHRCSVIGGPTPFLQQLVDAATARPELLSSLRVFFCGGAAVSQALMRKAADSHPQCLFMRAYGSTETPSTSIGSSRNSIAERIETDGEILPPSEIRFTEIESGLDVSEGEEGEILVRGPEQFLGYIDPADNAGAFDDDGYFSSGDLGRRIAGRFLLVTGRKKDIIIRSGENISPKEVEDILLGHPDIEDIAIVAMPSPVTGEKSCAFVVLRDNAAIDLAELTRFLENAGIARQKFPEHLVIVSQLPRVESGKISKNILRDEAKRIATENHSGS